MPTSDESMLDPITDTWETPEQKQKREANEQGLRDLLNQLPKKEFANRIG